MDISSLNFSWVIDGKLAGCAGSVLDRDLQLILSQGVRALVRLAGEEEGVFGQSDIEKSGLTDCHEPVKDFKAPSLDQVDRVIAFIERSLRRGEPVAVSCGAGYGRTGTMLSCYFVSRGLSAQNAIARVRDKGRKAYETEAQLQLIRDYERRVGNQPL
jgi:atypical dual specificity phosphatase